MTGTAGSAERVTPPHRLFRAATAAVVAASTGAGAHLLGGAPVHPVPVLVSAALLAGIGWLLAGRERGWYVLFAGQLAGQQLTHGLLGAAGGENALVPHEMMLHVHLVAALVTATWLQAGERRAWAVVEHAVAVCTRLLPTCGARPSGAGRRHLRGAGQAGADALLRHVLVRRGPPLPL